MKDLLSLEHRAMLETDSGILPAVIEQRGYRTVTNKVDLLDVGFSTGQAQMPGLLMPIWGADGSEPVSYQYRPDQPRHKDGKPVKYESLPKAKTRLDVPRAVRPMLADVSVELWITEGVKKADAAASRGMACVALTGVWNYLRKDEHGRSVVLEEFDHLPLRGRNVVICYDSDVMEKESVSKALEGLRAELTSRGALVRYCTLKAAPGQKMGLDDYFASGGSIEGLRRLIAEPRVEVSDLKPSRTDALIRLATELAKFWHDEGNDAYATVPLASGGFDNLQVTDRRFREWLNREWWKTSKQTASREAMDRTVESLTALARYEGETLQTAVRIGHADGTVWLDLGDPERRIVKVTPTGWETHRDQDCPIRFLRPKNMRALAEPVRGGSLEGLRQLLCVDPDGMRTIEAYMLGAFMPPPGGFPILVVTGEQGSGKSYGCCVLRDLFDPSSLALRKAPKDESDLGAALNSGYLLAFDNLSGVPGWLSDGLCSLATGGGLARRKLYTDAEELVVTGRRPVLLNGINDVVAAPDLAERCLFVEFTRPEGTARRTEADLNGILERVRGRILGSLLDRVSHALRDRGNVRPPGELPRLADFAVWVYAGTPDAQRGDMWRLLAENRKAKNLETIEDSPLASAILVLSEKDKFEGTARELLNVLNEQERIGSPKDRPEGWPASADALGKQLRRLKPVLAAVGVTLHRRRGKQRIWTVSTTPSREVSQASEASADIAMEPTREFAGEGACNGASVAYQGDGSWTEEGTLNLDQAGNDASDASVACISVTAGIGERRIERL